MAKPSKGTPKDRRLKANKVSRASKSAPFGGKRATPFAKGGGRKKR